MRLGVVHSDPNVDLEIGRVYHTADLVLYDVIATMRTEAIEASHISSTDRGTGLEHLSTESK